MGRHSKKIGPSSSARRPGGRREVRVVVAEPDAARRRGLTETITAARGLRLAGQAADASSTLAICEEEDPDIVVMGAELPGGDPLGTCRELAGLESPVRPLVVTGNGSPEEHIDFLVAGADGVVPESRAASRLPEAVATVASGEAVVGPELSGALLRRFQRVVATADVAQGGLRPVRGPLSTREWEVIEGLDQGLGAEEIARELGIARTTVHSHLRNIYRKLGVSSRSAAVEVATRLRVSVGAGQRRAQAER